MCRTATIVLVVVSTTVSLALTQKDEPESKDYSGISRMPGFFIAYNESAFDGLNFPLTQNGKHHGYLELHVASRLAADGSIFGAADVQEQNILG